MVLFLLNVVDSPHRRQVLRTVRRRVGLRDHPDQPVALMRQANAARDRVSMLVFAVLVMIGQSLAEDNGRSLGNRWVDARRLDFKLTHYQTWRRWWTRAPDRQS